MVRPVLSALALVATLLFPATMASGQVRIPDLDGRLIDPLDSAPGTKATVVLFVATDCPISNRYAPEVRRLHNMFASKGVAFRLVYPNPAESPDAVRAHVEAFSYPGRVLRDPEHALVALAGATVTPEAAVFDGEGRLVYRGRIDDRYLSFGLDRPEPTSRDLENALAAVLAGRPVESPVTRAVGCFLVDHLQP